MKNWNSILAFAFFSLLVVGCTKGDPEDQRVVARVYDSYLTADEIEGMLPSGLSSEDSSLLVNQYINSWAKEEIVVAKAKYNLGDNLDDLENLVSQYRKDLLKHRYEELYINQKLDTAITDREILDYYEANKPNFELKENILKAKYVVINNQVSGISDLEKKFKKNKEVDQDWIFGFVSQFATQYNLADTNWVRFNDLLKQLPLSDYNQREFLRRNKYVKLSDSSQTCFLLISEYKVEDDVSPLPYVRNTIKSIILNQRKLALLSSMEKGLVEDAYDKGDFEIY
jgi:hypothetical protein